MAVLADAPPPSAAKVLDSTNGKSSVEFFSEKASAVSTSTATIESNVVTASSNNLWIITLFCSLAVWPTMLTVPLVLSVPSSPLHFRKVFREDWYQTGDSPKPLGLCLGIFAVLVGQIGIFLFLYVHLRQRSPTPLIIQTKPQRSYNFWLFGVPSHLAQLEGFALLGSYLCGTWMLGLMPASYYEFDDRGIQWPLVAASLVVQDALQYGLHRLEHMIPTLYKYTHKSHHKHTNPSWFQAFSASVTDTIFMILFPLYVTTAVCLPYANVWTYMAFGSSFAAWLTLIHSEAALPWDRMFRLMGLGTPADHHVHHKFFKYNYGHTLMWWDRLFGTYRDPKEFTPHAFHAGV